MGPPAERSHRTPGPQNTTSRPTGGSLERTGGDLLSQAREGQVPSALWGLNALFGMGRGVSPTPKPPETCQDREAPRPRTDEPPPESSDRAPSAGLQNRTTVPT